MDQDIEDMRTRFLYEEFDETSFEVDADNICGYAKACGEQDPRFTDPSHHDFQASPTYVSTLAGERWLPDEFPRPEGVGMDAGKAVEWKAPIRAGTTLTGKSYVHDIYTKTGRSGRMIFVITRMELVDDEGIHVANADTSSVFKE